MMDPAVGNKYFVCIRKLKLNEWAPPTTNFLLLLLLKKLTGKGRHLVINKIKKCLLFEIDYNILQMQLTTHNRIQSSMLRMSHT